MPSHTSTITIPTDLLISFNTSLASTPTPPPPNTKLSYGALHAGGLRATGRRRGEKLGHILVFVWCPMFLYANYTTTTRYRYRPSKRISVRYEYLLTILDRPPSPTSPTHQKHLQPQKRTWTCITTITPLHDPDFTEKWLYAWSRSRPSPFHVSYPSIRFTTTLAHPQPHISLSWMRISKLGVVFYGVWMVVFVEWWNQTKRGKGRWGWGDLVKVLLMLALSAFDRLYPMLVAGRWVGYNYSWVITTIPKLIYTLVLFMPLIDFRSPKSKKAVVRLTSEPKPILRTGANVASPDTNAAATTAKPNATPTPKLIHINTNTSDVHVRGILQIRTHSPSPSSSPASLSPSLPSSPLSPHGQLQSPRSPTRTPTPPTPTKKVTFSLSHLHTPTYTPTFVERELVLRALDELQLPPSPFSSSPSPSPASLPPFSTASSSSYSASSSVFIASLFFPTWHLAPILALTSAIWGMRRDAGGVVVRYRRPLDLESTNVKSKRGVRGMKWIGWVSCVWASVLWYLGRGMQEMEGKDVLLVGLVASHVYLGLGWVVRRALAFSSFSPVHESRSSPGSDSEHEDAEWVDVTKSETKEKEEEEETEVVKEFWGYDEGVRDVKLVLDDA
ncbi:hypothetical protein VNI00_014874 [Paramarasmius palmivorus]|uniref:Uncharacterized protein n=1 Tax=Paramarasmius palmivorus TaxID=297713 RepID=A0AAW0BP52_9AGAR